MATLVVTLCPFIFLGWPRLFCFKNLWLIPKTCTCRTTSYKIIPVYLFTLSVISKRPHSLFFSPFLSPSRFLLFYSSLTFRFLYHHPTRPLSSCSLPNTNTHHFIPFMLPNVLVQSSWVQFNYLRTFPRSLRVLPLGPPQRLATDIKLSVQLVQQLVL